MPKNVQPRRGDIFMADLARDPLTRQSGVRPVVIIQNDRGNANSGSVIAVIVTSSHKKKLPTHVHLYPRHGVKRPSTAREEIWHWFDERHSKGVAFLLYGAQDPEPQGTPEEAPAPCGGGGTFRISGQRGQGDCSGCTAGNAETPSALS